jgi:spore coat protein I
MDVEHGSDLKGLALEVLKNYPVMPQQISIIQSGTIKTVWKIYTASGPLCLKRLKQTYDKALFSVNAQLFIKNKGGNVPGIIVDRNNQSIVQHKDQLFVLYASVL